MRSNSTNSTNRADSVHADGIVVHRVQGVRARDGVSPHSASRVEHARTVGAEVHRIVRAREGPSPHSASRADSAQSDGLDIRRARGVRAREGASPHSASRVDHARTDGAEVHRERGVRAREGALSHREALPTIGAVARRDLEARRPASDGMYVCVCVCMHVYVCVCVCMCVCVCTQRCAAYHRFCRS
jgi:hypothetical protein